MNTISVTLITIILCAFLLTNFVIADEAKQYEDYMRKKLCDNKLTDEQIAKLEKCYSKEEISVCVELT